MLKTAQTGQYGEELAQKHLECKGYEVLAKNWRFKRAEVDLICRKDRIIVFVEVKVRTNIQFGTPESFVNEKKMEKLKEAAEAYIEQYNWEGELRFDIISIEKNDVITHFEDAFY